MSNIAIVIPTYNPTELILSTLADLNTNSYLMGLPKIVVNDGSTEPNLFLQQLSKDNNVLLVHHNINLGKGAAIKTAIRALIEKGMPIDCIVTVDSDGQHLAKDVSRVIESALKDNSAIHIGSRYLERSKTPWRSLIGNYFSRKFFYCLYKNELKDTQSGLRAYPQHFLSTLLALKSDRYDFEMEAIIRALHLNVRICETQIETVYISKNQSSHFKPVLDSCRVLWIMAEARFRYSRNN